MPDKLTLKQCQVLKELGFPQGGSVDGAVWDERHNQFGECTGEFTLFRLSGCYLVDGNNDRHNLPSHKAIACPTIAEVEAWVMAEMRTHIKDAELIIRLYPNTIGYGIPQTTIMSIDESRSDALVYLVKRVMEVKK